MRTLALAIPLLLTAALQAQTLPATAPSTLPRNLDQALDEEMSGVTFNQARLETAIAGLRATTQTNIAVNWTALAVAGITRDTPVTLRLAHVTFEQVLRSMLEQLPAVKTRPNYLVGGNTVEITTTADLAKETTVKLFGISAVTSLSLTGKATSEQQAAHGEFVKNLVRLELLRAGEEPDGPGRELQMKDNYLVATQSHRAQLFIQQALSRLAAPVRSVDHAAGTLLSVRAKKAQDRMTELVAKNTLVELARNSEKIAPDLNVISLPGVAAEVAKSAPDLDYEVNNAGIVVLGSRAEIAARVMLAAYDLRDLLKRLAFKSKQNPPPTAAEFADSILAQVKSKVPPGGGKDAQWTDLGKSPTSMTLYESELIVTASPAVHRAIAAALQELNR